MCWRGVAKAGEQVGLSELSVCVIYACPQSSPISCTPSQIGLPAERSLLPLDELASSSIIHCLFVPVESREQILAGESALHALDRREWRCSTLSSRHPRRQLRPVAAQGGLRIARFVRLPPCTSKSRQTNSCQATVVAEAHGWHCLSHGSHSTGSSRFGCGAHLPLERSRMPCWKQRQYASVHKETFEQERIRSIPHVACYPHLRFSARAHSDPKRCSAVSTASERVKPAGCEPPGCLAPRTARARVCFLTCCLNREGGQASLRRLKRIAQFEVGGLHHRPSERGNLDVQRRQSSSSSGVEVRRWRIRARGQPVVAQGDQSPADIESIVARSPSCGTKNDVATIARRHWTCVHLRPTPLRCEPLVCLSAFPSGPSAAPPPRRG